MSTQPNDKEDLDELSFEVGYIIQVIEYDTEEEDQVTFFCLLFFIQYVEILNYVYQVALCMVFQTRILSSSSTDKKGTGILHFQCY